MTAWIDSLPDELATGLGAIVGGMIAGVICVSFVLLSDARARRRRDRGG